MKKRMVVTFPFHVVIFEANSKEIIPLHNTFQTTEQIFKDPAENECVLKNVLSSEILVIKCACKENIVNLIILQIW
jgi:hypothetical protein